MSWFKKGKDKNHICSFCGKEKLEEELMGSIFSDKVLICCDCLITGIERFSERIIEKNENPNVEIKIENSERNPKKIKNKNILNPRQIKEKLDEHVIGQEDAKKILSTACYNHLKRIENSDLNIPKSNILLLGPSGSGKTFVVEKLSEILEIPFLSYDATSMSATGYEGNSIKNIATELFQKCNGDDELCEKAIIYIDEIDKIASSENENGKDVGGKAVQQMLLKMIEGTEIVLDDVDEDYQITVNTKNILFIVSGAFEGMEEKTKGNKKIGFTESSSESKTNIIEKLMKFGMIKEFVGRFPVIAKFEQHTKESLQKILTEPKNSLVSQYQNIFLNDNIKLEINNEAIEEIAQISIENNTGARGLKNSMENLLADTMFEYLGNDNIEKVVITKETVSNKKPDIILKTKKTKTKKKAKKSFG